MHTGVRVGGTHAKEQCCMSHESPPGENNTERDLSVVSGGHRHCDVVAQSERQGGEHRILSDLSSLKSVALPCIKPPPISIFLTCTGLR